MTSALNILAREKGHSSAVYHLDCRAHGWTLCGTPGVIDPPFSIDDEPIRGPLSTRSSMPRLMLKIAFSSPLSPNRKLWIFGKSNKRLISCVEMNLYCKMLVQHSPDAGCVASERQRSEVGEFRGGQDQLRAPLSPGLPTGARRTGRDMWARLICPCLHRTRHRFVPLRKMIDWSFFKAIIPDDLARLTICVR